MEIWDADNHLYTRYLSKRYHGATTGGRFEERMRADIERMCALFRAYNHWLLGSDFPHPEGRTEPAPLTPEVAELSAPASEPFVGGNLRDLLTATSHAA